SPAPAASAGAALAGPHLGAAITLDGRLITGSRAPGDRDEFAPGVLAALERAREARRPTTLDHALRNRARGADDRYERDRLTEKGELTFTDHRFLGLPHGRWTAVRPDTAALSAGRVAATLART
ncbi:hypothetical protein VM98_34575, partial [Streptomyces rubellomurinus subsp. indigoferus]